MSRQVAILIPAAALLVAGCRTVRTSEEERSRTVSREAEVRTEVRTERVLVRDTVFVEVPAAQEERLTADSASFLATDYAESTARVLPDGRLLHTLRHRDGLRPAVAEVPVTVRESIVVRRDSTAAEVRERKQEERRVTARWWFLTLAAAAVIGIIALSARRK